MTDHIDPQGEAAADELIGRALVALCIDLHPGTVAAALYAAVAANRGA